jgi:GTP 3',8-cyclase
MKLRLSITDHCNFRCWYCRPTAVAPRAARQEVPSLETLGSVVAWLHQACGVTRVRLTGGEPLLRRGLERFVEILVRTPGIEEVSLTTNGALLARHALSLKQAGLARVNVSLDTLDSARFHALTGGGDLKQTLAGIAAACDVELRPLKLNAVLLRSTWIEDVPRLLDYAADCGAEMRFIELMESPELSPPGLGEYVPAEIVQQWLAQRATVRPAPTPPASTARLAAVTWAGRTISVGWITPRSAPFCATCERLRLDARGRLFRCLMDGMSLPLLEMIENEAPALIRQRLAAFLSDKCPPHRMQTPSQMVAIGG